MKKRNKILLIILSALILVLAIFIVVQWNNIKAITYYLFYPQDKVIELSGNNDEAIAAVLEKMPEVNVRDLTDEESEKLQSGELTPEDAASLISGKNDNEANDGEKNPSPTQNPEQEEAPSNERLEGLIAQVYVLRSSFTGSLNGLVGSAKAEYLALPEEERSSSKISIALRYLGLARQLEAQCDAQMAQLLSEISAELDATGGDTSVVSEMKSLYEAEKSIKKSEFLSMYGS